MAKIEFDREKCVKCRACVKDCITYSIDFDEEGYPKIAQGGEERCISCQHCFAICPTGAISKTQKKPLRLERRIKELPSPPLCLP